MSELPTASPTPRGSSTRSERRSPRVEITITPNRLTSRAKKLAGRILCLSMGTERRAMASAQV